MSAIALRRMMVDDVEQVVAIHVAAFPSFFLTFLGPRFLRALYRGVLEDPSGIAFVAERDRGIILGFVAGTSSPSRFYSRLLRSRLLRFGLATVPALLRKPAILGRLLRVFSIPAATSSATGRAELMSLGVLPASQGSGAGGLLTERFIEEAKSRGSTTVYLTTDADGNEAVNRFYERRSFLLSRQFTTPEGRRMNEYERRCQ